MPQEQALLANLRPSFSVDGQVQAALARDLVRLQLDEDLHGMMQLQVRFIASGPRPGEAQEGLIWLDGRVIDFGKLLSVAIGDGQGQSSLFGGKVSALELTMGDASDPELLCLAEDPLMDLRLTRRSRTYENVTDADLVRAIAAEHGLQAQTDLDGPSWPMVQQWNQSDLAFLRERTRRLAAELWVADNTLHVASRDRRPGSQLTLVKGDTLREVRLRADLAHQRSFVAVGGFDEVDQDAIDEQAGAEVMAGEAQGGLHGGTVLGLVFGERGSRRVLDVPLDDAQAQALARAALQQRVRRFVTVRGVSSGHAELRVGSRLRLERVSPLFEGDGYYVTRTSHRYDLTGGYRTHFEAERAWIGVAA